MMDTWALSRRRTRWAGDDGLNMTTSNQSNKHDTLYKKNEKNYYRVISELFKWNVWIPAGLWSLVFFFNTNVCSLLHVRSQIKNT